MRLLIVILLAALVAGQARAQDSTAEAAVVSSVIPWVTVATAGQTEIQARVPVSGTLVARREVQVFSQVSGYEVTEILVEAGDSVEKGQVLARLASDTLSAQLAQAEAEFQRVEATVSQAQNTIDSAQATLRQTVSELERTRSLRERGNATVAALDQAVAAEAGARAQSLLAANGLAIARAALAQADAARKIARMDLDRTEIKAPAAGLIAARNVELGALSGTGSGPVFTLIADGVIELSAEVIETGLQNLTVGDPADLNVAGAGVTAGKVRLLPATVDPVTRLAVIRISLDPVPGLRSGLFASGWIVTARRDAVTIPATAVLSDDQGDRVQVVSDGVIEMRPVRAGLLWQDRREVQEGLQPGEQVVARAGAFFRDGDRVKPTPAGGKAVP